MLIISGNAHLEVEESLKVFVIDVFVTPVIDLSEQLLNVEIIARCDFLLDQLLLTSKFKLFEHQFSQGSFYVKGQEILLSDRIGRSLSRCGSQVRLIAG